MFTTQHYRALASILHQSREVAIAESHEVHHFWYNHVYTPIVKLLEMDNPRFDSLTFSWAVATGDFSTTRSMRGDLLSDKSRENVEQVTPPC